MMKCHIDISIYSNYANHRLFYSNGLCFIYSDYRFRLYGNHYFVNADEPVAAIVHDSKRNFGKEFKPVPYDEQWPDVDNVTL